MLTAIIVAFNRVNKFGVLLLEVFARMATLAFLLPCGIRVELNVGLQ